MILILFSIMYFFSAGFIFAGISEAASGLFAPRSQKLRMRLSEVTSGLVMVALGFYGACFITQMLIEIYGPLSPTPYCTQAVEVKGIIHYVNPSAHLFVLRAQTVSLAIFLPLSALHFFKILKPKKRNSIGL